MAKIGYGSSTPRGRISAQTRTSQRTGRFKQQKRRTTVQIRRRIKRKKINNDRGFWLW